MIPDVIPGVGFLPENKRVYPNAEAAAHVLGFANVDNVGIAGIEKYIDDRGLRDLQAFGFAAGDSQDQCSPKPRTAARSSAFAHALYA